MKRLKWLILLDIVISTSTGNLPPQSYWAVFGPIDGSSTTAVGFPDTCPGSTPTVCSPPAVSTGPFIAKSPIDGSCSQIDYVQPNSTCHVTKWIACPQ